MPLTRIGSIDVNYTIDGDAGLPWLMLSNGLGLDLTMWAPQLEAVSQQFRVLRYDTRGHGGTSTPPAAATMDELGGDVLALMDHVGVERAHFCGFSMGGLIAIWLGIHAPARVERLVLAHTAARIGPVSMWNERIATVRAGGMHAISETAMRRWFTPDFIVRHPDIVSASRRVMERNDPTGYIHCCAAVRDADYRDDVAGIDVPTLVMSGAYDVATTPADPAFLAGRIRGAQRVEIDAAHLSNFERPQEFSAALLHFLNPVSADRVPARSAASS